MPPSAARARILVVDDEPRSVELLVRTLRRLGDVEPFTSGEQAWASAEAATPELVISDQRMPGMKGVELLARVARLERPVGRVLLTGYADIDATVEAINAGRIHAYVNKPWSPDQLAQTAGTLLERVRLERENESLVATLVAKNAALEQALASLRAAQDRVVASERLAAVGQLVAMIVHDLRGPLTVVRSAAAELARADASPSADEVRALAADALSESERMIRMCSELLDETRASENRGTCTPCELDEWIEEVVASIAEPAARQGVRVETRLGAATTLPLDAERLRRALLNLLFNALDAMPEGGLLRVETEREEGGVRLRVADTGPGVPEAIRDRLFDPFVTCGKPGGTGLGLAVVRKVVEDHGGAVSVGKAEGGGALFELRLPVAAAPR